MSYDHLRIKRYRNWDLFLHERQFPYIGRAYAWALREDAAKVTDMTKTERDELHDRVIPQWDAVVEELFDHDWTNVACLGNTSPHLHYHLIPRYNSPREFEGMKFVDPNPSGNYAPYPKVEIPNEILQQIKSDMQSKLVQISY